MFVDTTVLQGKNKGHSLIYLKVIHCGTLLSFAIYDPQDMHPSCIAQTAPAIIS